MADVAEPEELTPVQAVYQTATNAFARALFRDEGEKADKFLAVITSLQAAFPDELGSFAARVEHG